MTQYDPFAEQLFIGNEYVSSHQNVRDVINPSILQPCGRIADATPAEIDRVQPALSGSPRLGAPRRQDETAAPSRRCAIH